ncbi:hypothetical protein Bbelb_295670 [Branchiostoma belcheri]|nr:hypothetical protein Bbelb_295670 [Branchiostoma belcheri]
MPFFECPSRLERKWRPSDPCTGKPGNPLPADWKSSARNSDVYRAFPRYDPDTRGIQPRVRVRDQLLKYLSLITQESRHPMATVGCQQSLRTGTVPHVGRDQETGFQANLKDVRTKPKS